MVEDGRDPQAHARDHARQGASGQHAVRQGLRRGRLGHAVLVARRGNADFGLRAAIQDVLGRADAGVGHQPLQRPLQRLHAGPVARAHAHACAASLIAANVRDARIGILFAARVHNALRDALCEGGARWTRGPIGHAYMLAPATYE